MENQSEEVKPAAATGISPDVLHEISRLTKEMAELKGAPTIQTLSAQASKGLPQLSPYLTGKDLNIIISTTWATNLATQANRIADNFMRLHRHGHLAKDAAIPGARAALDMSDALLRGTMQIGHFLSGDGPPKPPSVAAASNQGENDGMEHRVAKLEETVASLPTKADLAELRSDFADLRADMKTSAADLKAEIHKNSIDLHRWMLGTVVGLFLGFGGLFLAMSNALKQPPATPQPQQPPVIITLPASPATQGK